MALHFMLDLFRGSVILPAEVCARLDILFFAAHSAVFKKRLRAEVKQVVWHEVAHWLGYETEEQVEALGL